MRDFTADLKIGKRNMAQVASLITPELRLKEASIAERQSKSSESQRDKLMEIYALAGELTAEISPLTPCRAGCSNCCHINISISPLEAGIIADEIGIDPGTGDITLTDDFYGSKCPLLVNEKCSVYHVRPYFCRRFISLMPSEYWCDHRRILNHDFPLLQFSEINRAYYQLINGGGLRDIRRWFQPRD
ncbi:YkgJ family cysteine cluster protein [Desulfotalea psychrophila]|uniref:YkgJ family cysteine cluster protein n=1 Tax=Desulfotalea psychrophila (strain LSv54 / DSM 12343) TaxID=177439 RepID=Q6AKL3_DESPS|nr:YkgJ family cysteine cluster protein [Desulfotalea psychrophila]CAG37112.1 hypothetical protein DP2383 [Desulfotalea psychrophila LSv54]